MSQTKSVEGLATELLPCPFCGSLAICVSRMTVTPNEFKVRCNNCFVRTGDFPTESEAVAHWNTRTDSNRARIEKLEAALTNLFNMVNYALDSRDALLISKTCPTMNTVRALIESPTKAES